MPKLGQRLMAVSLWLSKRSCLMLNNVKNTPTFVLKVGVFLYVYGCRLYYTYAVAKHFRITVSSLWSILTNYQNNNIISCT